MSNHMKIVGGYGQPIAKMPTNAKTGGATGKFRNTKVLKQVKQIIAKQKKKLSK